MQVSNYGNFRKGFQFRVRDSGKLSCYMYKVKLINRKTVPVHQIVVAAFPEYIKVSSDATPENFEIDHIDSVRENNRTSNLQILSRKENQKKASHPGSQKMAKAIEGLNPATSEWTTFSSQSKAREVTGISARAISQFLKDGKKKKALKGWLFRRIENSTNELLKGETFKKHPDLPVQVSNFGRVLFYREGRITEGNCYKKSAASVSVLEKQKMVHRLVLETFVGPCPAGCTADHIDRNQNNNRLENLRWASLSQQNRNRDTSNFGKAQGIPTSIRKKESSEWRHFETLGRCAEYIQETSGVNLRSVIHYRVRERAEYIAKTGDVNKAFFVGRDDDWEVKYTFDYPPEDEEGEIWRDIPTNIRGAIVEHILRSKEKKRKMTDGDDEGKPELKKADVIKY